MQKKSPQNPQDVVAISTDDPISGDGAEDAPCKGFSAEGTADAQTRGSFAHAVAVASSRPRGSGRRKLTYKRYLNAAKKIERDLTR
jgi:hypothetical protein